MTKCKVSKKNPKIKGFTRKGHKSRVKQPFYLDETIFAIH